jgi:predicted nucleic acid-binding Zn ribbon protein
LRSWHKKYQSFLFLKFVGLKRNKDCFLAVERSCVESCLHLLESREMKKVAVAVYPFHYSFDQQAEQEENQFVQMQEGKVQDEQYCDEAEAAAMEKRGRRLRRAALIAGIMYAIIIICTVYSTVAVQWVLIDWNQPELTTYNIVDNMAIFRIGIFTDSLLVILDTCVGVLIGLILIGAGVNPAMSVLTVVFKILQCAIAGANIIHLLIVSILLDDNLAVHSVIKTYVNSDYSQSTVFLFLLAHRFGYIFSQGKKALLIVYDTPPCTRRSSSKFYSLLFISVCRSSNGFFWIHHYYVGCLPSLFGIHHLFVLSCLHQRLGSLLLLAWLLARLRWRA